MMEAKVAEVLQVLGDEHEVQESEIRNTLWYYYFDVQQTVSWLLGISIQRYFPDYRRYTCRSEDLSKGSDQKRA